MHSASRTLRDAMRFGSLYWRYRGDSALEVRPHACVTTPLIGCGWGVPLHIIAMSATLNVLAYPISTVPANASQIIQSGHLPAPKPEAFFIGEIEKALRSMARQAKSREQLCSYMIENRYIHQLVETFEGAEKAEDLDTLHALCSCMQTIRE